MSGLFSKPKVVSNRLPPIDQPTLLSVRPGSEPSSNRAMQAERERQLGRRADRAGPGGRAVDRGGGERLGGGRYV